MTQFDPVQRGNGSTTTDGHVRAFNHLEAPNWNKPLNSEQDNASRLEKKASDGA